MPDHAVENARRRREALAASINQAQQDLEEWRRQIARVDRFLADYEAFAADSLPSESSAVSRPAPSIFTPSVIDGQKRMRASGNSTKEEVATAARRLIEEKGSPISREQLYDALKEEGLVISGTDPLGVMNTMLWRTRDEIRVILIRNVGYWLREREWRPAAYSPDFEHLLGVEADAPELSGGTEEDDGQTSDPVSDQSSAPKNDRVDWGDDSDIL